MNHDSNDRLFVVKDRQIRIPESHIEESHVEKKKKKSQDVRIVRKRSDGEVER